MFKFIIFTALIAFARSQAIGPGVPNSDCPIRDDPRNPTMLADPNSCENFIMCSGGLGFPMACPPNQHWAVNLNRCDWPEVAQCGGSSNETDLPSGCPDYNDPPTFLPHANCSLFYQCVWGTPSPLPCPEGQHWWQAESRCDWPEVAQCDSSSSTPDSCPAEVTNPPTFLPHETDCAKYYICDGRGANERDCPHGQHWWQAQSRCDWPDVANCTLGDPCPASSGSKEDKSDSKEKNSGEC